MVYCCVPCCTSERRFNSRKDGLSFHEFPSNNEMRTKWITNISRLSKDGNSLWTPQGKSVVCSLHFAEDCYRKNYTQKNKCLKKDAVPTFFTVYPINTSDKTHRKVYSSDRVEKLKADISGEPSSRFFKKITCLPGNESPTSTNSLTCKILEYGNGSLVERYVETESQDINSNQIPNSTDQERNEQGSILHLITEKPVSRTSPSSITEHLSDSPSHNVDGITDDSSQLTLSTLAFNLKRTRNKDQETVIANADSDTTERDEWDVFGELVVKKLKRYNSVTRHIVQHHINNILFQADMGNYDDPSTYTNRTSN